MKYFEFKKYILELWNSGDFKSRKEVAVYFYEQEGLYRYNTLKALQNSVRRIIRKEERDKVAEEGESAMNRKYNIAELIEEIITLQDRIQLYKDKNRILNKQIREQDARPLNAIKEYSKELYSLFESHKKSLLTKIKYTPLGVKTGGVGVLQFSDTHVNEIVNEYYNKYDTEIFAMRCKKYISESLSYFKFRGVKEVLILFTGDLINSDRRPDEVAAQATNRSKASFIAIHIFLQAILEVAKYYNITVISVMGNESRMDENMHYNDELASNNYDFAIVNSCKQIIQALNIKNIKFGNLDKLTDTVVIGKQRWFLAHDLPKQTANQKRAQSGFGQMSLQKRNIDFMIGGHLHSHNASDIYCRVGSFVGANPYSSGALALYSKASGVCYVVEGDNRYWQYIDLQNVLNEKYGSYEYLSILTKTKSRDRKGRLHIEEDIELKVG